MPPKKNTIKVAGTERKQPNNISSPKENLAVPLSYSAPASFESDLVALAAHYKEEIAAAGFGDSKSGVIRFAVKLLNDRKLWPTDADLNAYREYGIRGVIPDFVKHDFHELLMTSKHVTIFIPGFHEFLNVEGNLLGLRDRFVQGKHTQVHIPSAPLPDGQVVPSKHDASAIIKFIELVSKRRFTEYLGVYKTLSSKERQDGFHFCFSPPQVGFLEMRVLLTERECIVSHSPLAEQAKIAQRFAPAATRVAETNPSIISVKGTPTVVHGTNTKNDFYEHYLAAVGMHAFKFTDRIIPFFEKAVERGLV